MTEPFLNLSWPDAFAILGSVFTIVAGVVAAIISKRKDNEDDKPDEKIQIHERISGVKDRAAKLEGQLNVLTTQMENLIARLDTHEERDVDDFKTISQKVDKLMEIIVEMLRDDHDR